MTFVIDKEDLKPGLIIFRRGDVDHRRWYCRIKVPKADRYKTISLKTTDKESARERAFKEDARVQIRVEEGFAVFNRPFHEVAEEYALTVDKRAAAGEISNSRASTVRSYIKCHLNAYVGPIQIDKIGPDRWAEYPRWRRLAAPGRLARIGHTRPYTADELAALEAKEQAAVAKLPKKRRAAAATRAAQRRKHDQWVMVSDATIESEMVVFRAIMEYAISKRYVPAGRGFGETPDLEAMRRDEFSTEEYRALHTKGRAWIAKAASDDIEEQWLRAVTYLFVLIMCNTGMRPPEFKNMRWSDISPATDREGQEIVVIWVHGKDKQRRLVAPKSVGDYFERLRAVCQEKRPDVAMRPEDPVFTDYEGKSDPRLFNKPLRALLEFAKLLNGPSGIPRTTYCFRHTYATFRLSSGVDVYFLAEQMGTSVAMIEDHYGHVNTIRHAHLVLQGMSGWDPATDEVEGTAVPPTASPTTNRLAADRQAIRLKQPALPSKKQARH